MKNAMSWIPTRAIFREVAALMQYLIIEPTVRVEEMLFKTCQFNNQLLVFCNISLKAFMIDVLLEIFVDFPKILMIFAFPFFPSRF